MIEQHDGEADYPRVKDVRLAAATRGRWQAALAALEALAGRWEAEVPDCPEHSAGGEPDEWCVFCEEKRVNQLYAADIRALLDRGLGEGE